MVCEVVDGQVVAAAEQRVDPGRAVRRGELVAEQLALAAASFVGGHDLPVGRHVVARQVDPARSSVSRAAAGDDAAPVGLGADRHPAGVAEPHRAARRRR